ncbi:MAG: ribosome-associated translation inhibitor RaiA [Chlamydiae bacterium]|nr:ribosome-associated translation inhibitor RaiA [Chlamydiota bacterium]
MVDKEKFIEEEALGYNIYIIAKNFPLTEPMRQYVWEKLSKIERFHNHIFTVHVTLEIQKLEHVATIVCHFNTFNVKVEGRSTDMYASIDKAIDRMQMLFRKWKDRIQDYQKKPLEQVDVTVNVYRRPYDELKDINAEIEEISSAWKIGKVISTEKRPLKTLTMEEAVMKLELSGEPFLLFKDEVDVKFKVIYRREDGNYAIVQAE